jgi:hypothetical protein
MSLFVGRFGQNANFVDNNFILNSYTSPNVISLNLDVESKSNAFINFKGMYSCGSSGNNFIIGNSISDVNYLTLNSSLTTINTNINIKDLLTTANNNIYLNSNINFNLAHVENTFKISNKNNKNLLDINNDIINIGLYSNIHLENTSTYINSNLYVKNPGILYVNTISPYNDRVIINNAVIQGLQVSSMNYDSFIHIINTTKENNEIPFLIERYKNNNKKNIVDIFSCNIINNNLPIRNFCIDTNGNVSIGSNLPIATLYITPESGSSNIILYDAYKTSNSFVVNNLGYVGIGTIKPQGSLHINHDNNSNIINNPLINLDVNYNIYSNIAYTRVINTRYYAYNGIEYIYDTNDKITSYPTVLNNYVLSFNSTNNIIANIINNIQINVNFNLNNNDTLINYVPTNKIFPDYLFNNNNNNKSYNISPVFNFPSIFNILESATSKSFIENGTSGYIYNFNLTLVSKKTLPNGSDTTFTPDMRNYYQLIKNSIIYSDDDDTITLNIILNIEKGFFDYSYITNIKTVINPPYLLYANSNSTFASSISSTGKLNLVGYFDNNDYYDIYTKGISRIDNIECYNLSSIKGRNNINFSFCNISNINKGFITSNINKFLYADNSILSNVYINNLNIYNINASNILASNITSSNISSKNYNITNNNASFNMPIYIGNVLNNINRSYLKINVDNGYDNGMEITTNYNLNPILNINTNTNYYYPAINLKSKNCNYFININSNLIIGDLTESFKIYMDGNNIISHNNNYNIINIGNNSILADISSSAVRNNSNNKISFGYPRRFLINNSKDISSPDNWNYYFYNNTIQTPYMFNVYGSFNFSTISNKPLLKCIVNDINNEAFGVGIGIDPSYDYAKTLIVNGESSFLNNIYCDKTIFTSNCYVYNSLLSANMGSLSDMKVKTNIKVIENSLELVEKINGYRYLRTDTNKNEIGLIAQEVNEILPELIINENNMMHISYGNMAGIFIECIKKLNEKIKKLEEKMN